MKSLAASIAVFLVTAVLLRAGNMPAVATNSALKLTVASVVSGPTYGALHAGPGRQFVVLSTEWESRIDPRIASERGLATAYLVENLATHLYLVKDGHWIGTLRGGVPGPDKRGSIEKLSFGQPGAKIAGDLVFEFPDGAAQSLDLLFLDDTTGYMRLALAGKTPALPPEAALQKNDVMEVGILPAPNPAATPMAPPGFRNVAVELRARSTWLTEGEAPAYDGSQPAGATIQRVNLLDWPDTRKYIHVLADGDYTYPPADASTLPDSARFIPDFLTGGILVFQVPVDAKSLELICEMPHASAPGSSGTLDLPPMIFPLSGTRPAAAAQPALLEIKDEMFVVKITAARRAASFAGASAAADEKFCILNCTVENHGESGEFFQPHDQMLLLDAQDQEIPSDEVTARGPHRPEEQIHFPPGARRRFEIVYRVPAAVAAPRLSYHGGSFQQAYDVPWAP